MSNLQMIQVVINMLLKEPTEAYKVADHLLSLGFDSYDISLVLDELVETGNIRVNDQWKLYLTPPIEE